MGNPTIRDVARCAGVSVASVSRTLNGSGLVSEATKERINKVVQDLLYVPHAGARSLSLAKNNAIGVMLPAVHGEFFSEIIRGMDMEAVRCGYLLLLSNLHTGSSPAIHAMNAIRGRVDGLLLMAPHLDEKSLAAIPATIPTVLINSPGPSGAIGAVHIDNRAGVTSVIEHLAALGRKRIAYIGGPQDNFDAKERGAAFLAAVESFGLEYVLVDGDFLEESGARAVEVLIRDGIDFDAIFAANDNMAIGAFEELRARNRRVPEDVAVAGFDDIPLARHLDITTVRVRIAEMGQRALAKLVAALEGADERQDEFHQPELVIRGSTCALAREPE